MCASRGACRSTSRAYVDAIVEVFNLFNRTNFTQVNSTWGPGAYPDNPLPTFGQFTAAAHRARSSSRRRSASDAASRVQAFVMSCCAASIV